MDPKPCLSEGHFALPGGGQQDLGADVLVASGFTPLNPKPN